MPCSRRQFLMLSFAALEAPRLIAPVNLLGWGGQAGSDQAGHFGSDEQGGYDQVYRPQFHFSPRKNFMNDPNGLVYYRGEYHLFYQYNPFAEVWGHMSWGHAVSDDLFHWKSLPVAMREYDGYAVFSGSAVVDWKNTSGFGSNDNPPLIAIYAADGHGKQTQNIAYSLDRGRTWHRYKNNPVIDIDDRNFRDPKVFWYEPEKYWVMVTVLAAQKKVSFYASKNLREWRHLSNFGPAGNSNTPGWECPDLYRVPVSNEPGVHKWVLVIGTGNHLVAGGSGVEYFIGEFDGKKFVNGNPPDRVLWVDDGMDFYAAQTYSDIPPSDGRRIMIGWMNDWKYGNQVPTHPWRGQQSVPRVVTLKRFSSGIRMMQAPVTEIEELRSEHLHIRDFALMERKSPAALKKWPGETLEILAEFEVGSGTEFGLKVRKGPSQETVIGFDVQKQEIFVDRTHSGDVSFNKAFPIRHAAPLVPENGRVKFHVLLDRCSVEVFANDGIVTMTDLIFPDPSGQGLEVYSKHGHTTLRSLDVWRLKSAWRTS